MGTDAEHVRVMAERTADRVIRHGYDRAYLIGTLESIYEDWLVLHRQIYPKRAQKGEEDGPTVSTAEGGAA